MKGVLSGCALQELVEVPIWVERTHPGHACTVYHNDVEALHEKGMNPDKLGAVEIANAEAFLDAAESQPGRLLHEMARAYLDRRWGGRHEGLEKAYALAFSNKRYEDVLHMSGQRRRHVALESEAAYFAEASEAYFGRNDHAPFDRSALASHDPGIHALLPDLWAEAPIEARLLGVKNIWNAAKHNAFTDLVA